MNKMAMKWNKSEGGYVESKCGRFEIEPVWMGRTTAQAYNLFFRKEPNGPREQIKRYCDTQRDTKELAEHYSKD